MVFAMSFSVIIPTGCFFESVTTSRFKLCLSKTSLASNRLAFGLMVIVLLIMILLRSVFFNNINTKLILLVKYIDYNIIHENLGFSFNLKLRRFYNR